MLYISFNAQVQTILFGLKLKHFMFPSFYQYMATLELGAREGLDMELVLVHMVLVQEAMVQDLEGMELAQVATVLGQVDME